MKKSFVPLAVVTALLFVIAPILIARAPYESEMLLIQKIFYFHVPSWVAMYCGLLVCAVGSIWYLFKGNRVADRYAESAAELVLLFGLNGLVSGPLWARKAWGVWWQWDAKLTSALLLWLIFVAYLLVRKYGGPGSEKLAAAVGIFGAAVSPFVYVSVNIWRTIHPKTSVVPDIVKNPAKGFAAPLLVSMLAFVLLFVLLLMVRVYLAAHQDALDELYLAHED
ncbi:MAG: cytochrome C assembly protein [Acidobacteria bacterium]|nr:MAG: cytochrome C assembly protein [Acidobacteriota bacterium]PYQ84514.1 MAG: cytochrome C assembly protein [Acidobacteriota bacterium]PYQ89967.1 MAG: cytochrome C assembly protein [Acidobacteriota bacterium]PYR08922.1 MAG: cytochrome C assembly protein [Acidobacteriota bacterium]